MTFFAERVVENRHELPRRVCSGEGYAREDGDGGATGIGRRHFRQGSYFHRSLIWPFATPAES